MNVALSYLGRSGLIGDTMSLAPNLAREPVAFDAALKHPLRFREAISALHDVVIGDYRFKRRDKSAYEAWKLDREAQQQAIRSAAVKSARDAVVAGHNTPIPPDFERQHAKLCKTYWHAREAYATYLRKHDMALWRMLMPCDPVITVADDVVFFECFSADESSYGCLTVDRDSGFGTADGMQCGTTNVDYSWDLYHHFQSLRSYRETRFRLDPAGFDVATHGAAEYREEKIDLPNGWLRGFMQIQAAMTRPMRRVTLNREAVYSLLLWLRRHKARSSPRALRFDPRPGGGLALMLEPWEQEIPVYCTPGAGESRLDQTVRIWGRQRLLALARVLPLVDSVDVYLLGTGFPSFWVARMGEMRLTLGLSGWTANDWTRGSSLDLLELPVTVDAHTLQKVSEHLKHVRAATFEEINGATAHFPATTSAALKQLAHSGQLIYDLVAGVYRWRQIMPHALGVAELGPENPEVSASQEIVKRNQVVISSRTAAPSGGTLLAGTSDYKPVEMVLDLDGRIKRARCLCGHFQKAGLRMGPCRHLLAFRWVAMQPAGAIGSSGMPIPAGQKGGV